MAACITHEQRVCRLAPTFTRPWWSFTAMMIGNLPGSWFGCRGGRGCEPFSGGVSGPYGTDLNHGDSTQFYCCAVTRTSTLPLGTATGGAFSSSVTQPTIADRAVKRVPCQHSSKDVLWKLCTCCCYLSPTLLVGWLSAWQQHEWQSPTGHSAERVSLRSIAARSCAKSVDCSSSAISSGARRPPVVKATGGLAIRASRSRGYQAL